MSTPAHARAARAYQARRMAADGCRVCPRPARLSPLSGAPGYFCELHELAQLVRATERYWAGRAMPRRVVARIKRYRARMEDLR